MLPVALPADVAQSVERILGKDEVTGSNPVISSTILSCITEDFVALLLLIVQTRSSRLPRHLRQEDLLLLIKGRRGLICRTAACQRQAVPDPGRKNSGGCQPIGWQSSNDWP